MKKFFLIIAFLCAAIACGPPAANNQPPANTTKPAETKPAVALTEADTTAKEKEAWDAVQKKNYDAFGALLDSSYVEIESDGIFDKAGIINAVKSVALTEVTFSDWKYLPIDKDAVLITYTASYKGTFKGKPFPASSARCSSAWVNRGGKWLSVYHQETDVKPAPKQPPPPPPKKSSSPAAATTATTGPDPIANEKLVWDAFKRGDFDAFAAMLAPESVEVEQDGVYDKAASVKGVSQIDFSNFELSEWKALKFDDDAALVSYIVKVPKAPTERHASIWINRGGKWVALFHQGTPQAAPAPAATK